MSKYNFVHLHNHSEYSLLDGMIRTNQLASKAHDLGMNAVALTDHGNMYGAIEFYTNCTSDEKINVKPIIGNEVYVAEDGILSRNSDEKRKHLVLLAKNKTGYDNLLKITSASFTEGFYYKPRVDHNLIEKYSDGIIALSGCIAGEIPQLILADKMQEADRRAKYYKELFGKDSFFLELQYHGLEEDKKLIKELYAMSKRLEIPLVATNDAHYLEKADSDIHDTLLCIGTKKKISDQKRMRFPNSEFYFKSEEEMIKLFDEIPSSLINTQNIAQMCELEIKLPGPILPEFDVPDGYDKSSYLYKLTEDGLKKKYNEITPQIRERMEMELNVINNMGFPGYFLIVWDFIKYAKDHGIWVGPGRGSGAGSIVAFGLGITNIEPLKYDLLFERFLNIERVSMPDFDIDFCKERREEVITYVNNKYSKEKVSQIITFGAMKTKSVIRDVGRVLDIPHQRVDEIVKNLPKKIDTSLSNIIAIAKENSNPTGNLPDKLFKLLNDAPAEDKEKLDSLLNLYENGVEEEKKMLKFSLKLEGLTRQTGVHACGVVIGKEKITDYVPLQIVKDPEKGNLITTQFPGPQLEKCGLVKMDFLGLITLTLMRKCTEILEKKNIKIDLDKIDTQDSKVFDLFSRGDTLGVFQFESEGMQMHLKNLKPTKITDIIAMNALYRPGPMKFIESFIARKHGKEQIQYDHPLMEDVLKETYGIMVYQEQVMKIAQVLAGYSLGEADVLRRAMGKKKAKEMEAQKEIFIKGAREKNNIDKERAVLIFTKMEDFANYGFNKSHAAAYSYIAYQTAYLKAHYPTEYLTALLSSVIGNPDDIQKYLEHCFDKEIKVLPPNVNKSNLEFEVEDNNIRYALTSVKGCGENASKSIIEARKENNGFKSFEHFIKSIDLRVVNKTVLETLIKCGGLDDFGHTRKWMVDELPRTIKEAQEYQNDLRVGQNSLFGEIEETSEVAPEQIDKSKEDEYDKMTKLNFEKDILGFFASDNPLSEYQAYINNNNCIFLKDIKKIHIEGYRTRQISFAAIIDNITIKTNEHGGNWAIIEFIDNTGKIEARMYKEKFSQYGAALIKGKFVLIHAICKRGNKDTIQIIIESMENLESAQYQDISEFHIYLKDNEIPKPGFESLRNDLNEVSGTSLKIIFHMKDTNGYEKKFLVSGLKAPKDETYSEVFTSKYDFIEKVKLI